MRSFGLNCLFYFFIDCFYTFPGGGANNYRVVQLSQGGANFSQGGSHPPPLNPAMYVWNYHRSQYDIDRGITERKLPIYEILINMVTFSLFVLSHQLFLCKSVPNCPTSPQWLVSHRFLTRGSTSGVKLLHIPNYVNLCCCQQNHEYFVNPFHDSSTMSKLLCKKLENNFKTTFLQIEWSNECNKIFKRNMYTLLFIPSGRVPDIHANVSTRLEKESC